MWTRFMFWAKNAVQHHDECVPVSLFFIDSFAWFASWLDVDLKGSTSL